MKVVFHGASLLISCRSTACTRIESLLEMRSFHLLRLHLAACNSRLQGSRRQLCPSKQESSVESLCAFHPTRLTLVMFIQFRQTHSLFQQVIAGLFEDIDFVHRRIIISREIAAIKRLRSEIISPSTVSKEKFADYEGIFGLTQ